ncbi:MAG TPA: four helix bundle protein [Chitinophagales bacterium]|nr:four helix bundle protein [Chitinophagales bacterium]
MLQLNHKNLEVWKQSIALVKLTYSTTSKLPKEEQFNLTSQMRRAAVSICANISEGAARKSEVERKRYYEISRSSLVELDTHFEICLSLGYISKADIENLEQVALSVFKMISKLS